MLSHAVWLLAHHYGDWKLLDGKYVIDVGGLADAISTGAIRGVRVEYFDKTLLERSVDRVEGASRQAGEDFFPPALARPALVVICEREDIVVIDGHRRARQLFTRCGETEALFVAVSLDDAMKYGKHVDELPHAERRLLEAMRSNPVRLTADADSSFGTRIVPVFIPQTEVGRSAATDEVGVLDGAVHALAREILKRAKKKHGDDPRRRLRFLPFSTERYLRGIVAEMGDFTLSPYLGVALSTLRAEYADSVADLRKYSTFYFGREDAMFDRLFAGEDRKLETRFVLLSRALAAAQWYQRHSKLFGAIIDPRSHTRKNFTGTELSEKITGGRGRIENFDLPLRALCDIARLIGVNTAHLFPRIAHAHEIVEWYRLIFFLEHGHWRDISERSLAMNFSLWWSLWSTYTHANGARVPPGLALLWKKLFTLLSQTPVPPDAPDPAKASLLDLYLEISHAHVRARRGQHQLLYV